MHRNVTMRLRFGNGWYLLQGNTNIQKTSLNSGKVIARSRFELLSRDPESRMIDRYTTGLRLYDYAAWR